MSTRSGEALGSEGKAKTRRREPCPVARTTELIGDKWSLLILRNAGFGVTRFEQLQTHLGVSRATLTDRLGSLVGDNFLERVAYQDNPKRYEYKLTAKGRALFDVIAVMWRFGEDWLFSPGVDDPSLELRTKAGAPIRPVVVDESTGAPIDCREVRVRSRNRPDRPQALP